MRRLPRRKVITPVARKRAIVKHVLLIDDQPLIHEVMRKVIARAVYPQEILVAKDLAEAAQYIRELTDLDLVIMDLKFPGKDGIAALAELRKRFPKPKYVILSALDDRETVVAALEAGADGYVTKTSSIRVIEAALSLVTAGGAYAPPEILRHRQVTSHASLTPRLDITERQLEVLRLLLQGLPNRHIAKTLHISESTVKQHVRGIFHALNVSSRTEALVAATKLGITLE